MPRRHTNARKKRAHVWDRDPFDFYIEDQWVSAELFKSEKFPLKKIHDPFCGIGRILIAAMNYGNEASGSDLVARGVVGNFRILDGTGEAAREMFKWDRHIVSNPPFGAIDHLLRVMSHGIENKCALFMRFTAVAGKSRLLRDLPLARILICKPRPNCLPGAAILRGEKPGGGFNDYAWLIFEPQHHGGPTVHYLNKSQPTDYRKPKCLAATTSRETPITSAP